MISNSAPKNWKQLIKPYKAYLQAAYPAPTDKKIRPQEKGRWWHLQAKKTDFNWFNGQPIPRIRADMATSIERMLKPMSYETAIKKATAGDSLSVKVHFHTERKASTGPFSPLLESKVETRNIYVKLSIKTAEDKAMLRALMKITKSWVSEMKFEEDDWRESNHPPQHRVKSFYKTYADIHKWLVRKGCPPIIGGSGSSMAEIWWVIAKDSSAQIRPKKATRAGPAYNHPSSNCAIEAIKMAMAPIDAKQEKVFSTLQTKYSQGVWPDDYEVIARKLGRNIQITFAPSSEVAKKWIDSGLKMKNEVISSFGIKTKKTIHLHHWGNHATAMIQKPKHEYKYATPEEMTQATADRYEQIYQTGESSITFRNKLDGVFETLQLAELDGVKLELGKTTPQSQLFDEFKAQIVPFSYNDPNREAYDQFAKHGIHFSIGGECESDYDFDLKNAYSSYASLSSYRGLPRDITYWINNPTIDQVKANSGFVLTRFTDPIKNCEITAWVACCAIDVLHENGLVHEMTQAAFAHKSFDLDTSKFIDPENIGKRVFHKILGLSTMTQAKRRFITADAIETFDHNVAQLRLPECVDENAISDAMTNHVSIGVKFDIEANRYSHVAATIQDCITAELWRKWIEVKASNPDARIISALVDGLRVSSSGIDKDTFNYDNGRWVAKPIRGCGTQPQCDWLGIRYAIRAKIASDNLIRADWAIGLNNEYKSMMSVGNPSFAQLAEEGYIVSFQGFAGCGKSYRSRQLLEQCNAVILTPTHSTREDMESYSIRDYVNKDANAITERIDELKLKIADDSWKHPSELNSLETELAQLEQELAQIIKDDELTNIPVKTYQSIIQRPNAVDDFQVIIIDECGMLLAEHLNRIVEMVGRKLIILVGDPAQHKPIYGEAMYLEAKYLVFKEHIESNDELREKYHEGSEWVRNNMLSKLAYDCTFEFKSKHCICDDDCICPLPTEDEELFDEMMAARDAHIAKMRSKVSDIASMLSQTFNFQTPREVAAFDIFYATETLEVVKRAEDSDEGRALIKFCEDVRNGGIDAIYRLCNENPEYHIDSTPFYPDEKEDAAKDRLAKNDIASDLNSANVIARCNSYVDGYNAEFAKKLLLVCDTEATEALQEELKQIIEDEKSSDNAKEMAELKLKYAYVDADIRVVARSTFSINGAKVFNGTRGVMRNFMIDFDGVSIPLVEEHIPRRKTPLNPFKRPVLRIADVSMIYSSTSYRVQGRTISDGLIYIDCNFYSSEMLYVAVSRARRIDQLRFIYPFKCDVVEEMPEGSSDIIEFNGILVKRTPDAYLPMFSGNSLDGYQVIDTNSLKLGFKTIDAETIRVGSGGWYKLEYSHLKLDWSDFDWESVIAIADDVYGKAMRAYEKIKDTDEDAKEPIRGSYLSKALAAGIKHHYPDYEKESIEWDNVAHCWVAKEEDEETEVAQDTMEDSEVVQDTMEDSEVAQDTIAEASDKFVDLFGMVDWAAIGLRREAKYIGKGVYYQMIGIMTNENVDIPTQRATIKAMLEHNESIFAYDRLDAEKFFRGDRKPFTKFTIDVWLDKVERKGRLDEVEMWMDVYDYQRKKEAIGLAALEEAVEVVRLA